MDPPGTLSPEGSLGLGALTLGLDSGFVAAAAAAAAAAAWQLLTIPGKKGASLSTGSELPDEQPSPQRFQTLKYMKKL